MGCDLKRLSPTYSRHKIFVKVFEANENDKGLMHPILMWCTSPSLWLCGYTSIPHLCLKCPNGCVGIVLLLPCQIHSCRPVQVILNAQSVAFESVTCNISVRVILVMFGIKGECLIWQFLAKQNIPTANADCGVCCGSSCVFSINPFPTNCQARDRCQEQSDDRSLSVKV